MKCLDDGAIVIFGAVGTGGAAFANTAHLDFSFGFCHVTRAIRIADLTAFAGLLVFPAGFAVCAATTDFQCIHREETPLNQDQSHLK